MSVKTIANDDDQGNRFTSISICSDQIVDEEDLFPHTFNSFIGLFSDIQVFFHTPECSAQYCTLVLIDD